MHDSSTETIPNVSAVPRHIAIIMDGNGRWAKQRFMPRVAGHKRGVESVREVVKACGDLGVEHLTLFAFSSENWRRPADEVSVLMQLFIRALEGEVAKLHANEIRFRVVGDLTPFDRRIRELIASGEELTRDNKKLTLTIAANYGGRWDILQAANKAQRAKLQQIRASQPDNEVGAKANLLSRKLSAEGGQSQNAIKSAPMLEYCEISEAELAQHLSMSYAPEQFLLFTQPG